jgi:nicotinate-nucleotide pyrophosphorylase (carboxylating)
MSKGFKADGQRIRIMFLPPKILEEKLLRMLAEDLGQGDLTTALIVPEEATSEAEVIAKEEGVAAGIEEARTLLESLGAKVETLITDGDTISKRQTIMRISGNTRTILSAERTMLNLISRMSGIATATRRLVEKLRKAKLKTRVASTRKTAPGLLYFDKKAVWIGGGDTHRLHLDDMVLIKDNHIAVAGSIAKVMEKAKEKATFSKKIEIEVTNIRDAVAAAEAGADVIMLDNFSPKQVEGAVRLLAKSGLPRKVLLEASGGITSENIVALASTGVDIVSLGEITHSPKALNLSLEITKTQKNQTGT